MSYQPSHWGIRLFLPKMFRVLEFNEKVENSMEATVSEGTWVLTRTVPFSPTIWTSAPALRMMSVIFLASPNISNATLWLLIHRIPFG